MAQVAFYLLGKEGEKPHRTICKLADKYAATGGGIYLYSDDPGCAIDMDDLLWEEFPDSYIAHERFIGEQIQEPLPPLLIGTIEPPPTHRRVLLMMSRDVPGWYGSFDRVVEVVPRGKDVRADSRVRFKKYREQGHALKTFQQDSAARGAWKLMS